MKQNPPQTLEIITRLIFAILQSKGRLGKSWTLLLLASWLDRHGINWTGYDLDDAHRSFSKRYPDVKELTITDEITGRDEILKIFRTALSGAVPVSLSDTRAQLAPFILDTIERTQCYRLAAEKSVRLTALVFPADDDDSLRSLVEGMQRTGTQVDYLAVLNPALYSSRRYDGSPLQKTLLSAGAQEITIPPLMESTRRAIARAEAQCGNALSFPAALEYLKDFAKADLEFFLSSSFQQFDRVAKLLLPSAEALKISFSNPVAKEQGKPFTSVGINLNDE